jgi:hypothetical protein
MEGERQLARGVPARLTAREGRKFAFTLGIAFAVLGGILWWRGHLKTATVLGAIGAAFLLAGLLVPSQLGPVQRGWMGFALLLSKVTTPIFMGIVYFFVVSPIGLIMRALGKNPMRPRQGETYWVARSATGGRGTMSNQF